MIRRTFSTLLCFWIAGIVLPSVSSGAPIYTISPFFLPSEPSALSSGSAISPDGEYLTGWAYAANRDAGLAQSQGGETVELPSLSDGSHPYLQPRAVNNNGVIVGTGYATEFRSSPVPLIWENNRSVTQLPLPSDYEAGKAHAVNDAGLAVGLVVGLFHDQATLFTKNGATVLTQTIPNGGILYSAFDVNNGGQIVGSARNPDNPSTTRAFSLTPGSLYATDLGTLEGDDSSIAYGVSENGYVVGSSSSNATITPVIWSVTTGMIAIPKNGYFNGSAEAVNSDGWAVGTVGSLTSVPFLYDGETTYLLNDLIPPDSGWDLMSGTSNAALSISEDGTITGRGLYDDVSTGFVMTLVPEPNSIALLLGAILSCCWIRRR